MWRLLYTALWLVALPFALLRLWWRGRAERGYRAHIAERLGFGFAARPATPRLAWVHAVSVGETQAAQPLINALLADDPELGIVLTHMTPTGRQTGARLFADACASGRLVQAYLPYDLPWLLRPFLSHFRPAVACLMETEIWPNLLATAVLQQVPMVLVNGRLSPRSYRRSRYLGAAAREVYRGFTAVLAQTEGDAQRYRQLGVRDVRITGNLKFDITPPQAMVVQGRALRVALGRAVFCAGSTREGEEGLLLPAWAAASARSASGESGNEEGKVGSDGGDTERENRGRNQGRDGGTAPTVTPLLIIVPRHPQRFDEVAALAGRLGLSVVRRSTLPGPPEGWPLDLLRQADVLLGDSMGEMPQYYAASDAAYIGGSLLPLGGQNLIEACAVGTPVLVGPHTFNFAQATDDALGAGAALRMADASSLVQSALQLLDDTPRRERMAAAACIFSQSHQGAAARTLGALKALMR